MLKRVKFTASGSCREVGAFEPGDVANVSEEMAKHLVEDVAAAEYEKGEGGEGSPSRVHSTPESRLALRKDKEAGTKAARVVKGPHATATPMTPTSELPKPAVAEKPKKAEK